jgi:hypothetical protein
MIRGLKANGENMKSFHMRDVVDKGCVESGAALGEFYVASAF